MLMVSGFSDIRITMNEQGHEFIRDWLPDSEAEEYIASATIPAAKSVIDHQANRYSLAAFRRHFSCRPADRAQTLLQRSRPHGSTAKGCPLWVSY